MNHWEILENIMHGYCKIHTMQRKLILNNTFSTFDIQGVIDIKYSNNYNR